MPTPIIGDLLVGGGGGGGGNQLRKVIGLTSSGHSHLIQESFSQSFPLLFFLLLVITAHLSFALDVSG